VKSMSDDRSGAVGASAYNGNGQSSGNVAPWCDPLVVQSHWWWFV
jgi:hypothetical protein